MLTGITEWLQLSPSAVVRGQVWRFFTYDFLHGEQDPWHIIFNMFILYMTGKKLLTYYSQREFLTFYLTAGALSGLAFVIWQLMRGDRAGAVGASGAVSAAMMLYALHWPREIWLIFGIIPIPVIVIVILKIALDLHPMLGQLSGKLAPDGVAHSAHLGGMAFAFLYYQMNWRLEGLLDFFRLGKLRLRWRPRTKLKVHRPTEPSASMDPAALQEEVDRLLEKIHLEGEQSLSDAERDVLNTASRILRNRRGTKA
jgi:membrane associated rhomboid family serine protease